LCYSYGVKSIECLRISKEEDQRKQERENYRIPDKPITRFEYNNVLTFIPALINMSLDTSTARVNPQGTLAIDQVSPALCFLLKPACMLRVGIPFPFAKLILSLILRSNQPATTCFFFQEALRRYLQEQHIPGFTSYGSCTVYQFSHGQSNPTYLIHAPDGQTCYVLRKKPPGPTLPSAHAIEREYAVLAALGQTEVPVPHVFHLCQDSTIIGTPFYVMEHVRGRVFLDPSCPELSPSGRAHVYRATAATLAALHSVNPQHVGLQNFGPRDGYAARQVSRWRRQYVQSVPDGQAPMAEMVRLAETLASRVPTRDSDPSMTRISHGDFRLDNLVFHPERNDVVLAALDWELCTLGDPLADLAYCCLAWRLPAGLIPGLPALPRPLPDGVPSETEFVQMYCHARDVALPERTEWTFYVALALFRLAAILAGVGARAKQGNASSAGAAKVGADQVVRGLAGAGLQALEIDSIDRADGGIGPSTATGRSPQTSIQNGLNPSSRAQVLLSRLKAFMKAHVYPAETVLNEHATSDRRWSVHPVQEELKVRAKEQGLWNLWVSPNLASSMRAVVCAAVSDPRERSLLLGPGLSNLDYAHLAEEMGRSFWAPEAFNCSAPDTGNMEVLARYGNERQQREWLVPLLRGDIRSCFAMTEPAVASSDATNVQSSIERCPNGNEEYLVNGRKWWISGACDRRCKIAIFMGKTDTNAPVHKQQSMVLIPMNSKGVQIVRPLPVFGFDDAPHGHAEMVFDHVCVPSSGMILGEGRGFEIAQGRLGPGRLHHCMRAIGMGERALEIMVARSLDRIAFKKPLAGHQDVRMEVARSRMELDAARLVVLEAALALDLVGAKAARGKIAAAKALAPSTVLHVLDRSIQLHGGAGVGDTTPLAWMWASARTLRLADGPDVVHLETIAKLEVKKGMERAKL
jgi:acyl-CoA dehydrogenase